MNFTDINLIIKKQISSSQIALLITSLCFQILIVLGYIRSIILKDRELKFFMIPFLFIALLMESISFGIRKNDSDKSLKEFILYLMITIFLSIILLFHFFIRRFLKYKSNIHTWSFLLLLFSILFTFILLI